LERSGTSGHYQEEKMMKHFPRMSLFTHSILVIFTMAIMIGCGGGGDGGGGGGGTAVGAPTFSPTPGAYATAQSVTISTTTAGATIRYTTDGSTPSETVGTVYSGPISVTTTTTIKAIAYMTGLTTSSVSTAVYTISGGTVNLPLIAGFPGTDSVTENTVRFIGWGVTSIPLSAVTYFEYSSDLSFVGALRTPDQVVVPLTINYYAQVSGLSPVTFYYYRQVATNAAGTSFSPQQPLLEAGGFIFPTSFFRTNTAAGWPIAGTGITPMQIFNITQSSAQLESTVYSSQPAKIYFQYDTDGNFTNASRTPDQDIGTTPINGTPVSAALSGLLPATTYYVRLVATNATGTSTGLIIGFRTLP